MQETYYKSIGKKGRTTIPLCMRIVLGIRDDTLLRFTRNSKQVIITPMRECESGICEMHRKASLDTDGIKSLVDEISDETLAQMPPVIINKLKGVTGEKSGMADQT